MDEAAEVPEVALAGGVQHRAGAEKQQTLHERVIHRVIHDRNQGERRGGAHAHAGEHDREAETGEHDADVFDGGIGEQTLHIRLRGREHDAIQRTEQAERERQQSPPPHRQAQQIETHADHSVQRGLQHDAAHQRGNR